MVDFKLSMKEMVGLEEDAYIGIVRLILGCSFMPFIYRIWFYGRFLTHPVNE